MYRQRQDEDDMTSHWGHVDAFSEQQKRQQNLYEANAKQNASLKAAGWVSCAWTSFLQFRLAAITSPEKCDFQASARC